MVRHSFLSVSALLLLLASLAPLRADTGTAPAAPAPWQVTCYGEGTARNCEAVQSVTIAGTPSPLAQVALGWLSADAPLMLSIVVAPDISLSTPLTITIDGMDPISLPWTRCRPGGCFAGLNPTPDHLAALRRAETDGARLAFTDGVEAANSLRLPLAGIGAAIDALEKARAD